METSDRPIRQRTAAACEACRDTKMRCRPSEEPGVCRKCLVSKRECIIRPVARVRRLRSQKISSQQQQESCPIAPASAAAAPVAKTFSIEFAVAAKPEVDDHFETLRDCHSLAVDGLFPEDDVYDDVDAEFWGSPLDASSATTTTTATASTTTSTAMSMSMSMTPPSFNLASAESLLLAFRSTLPHMPCIALPEHQTVSQLAASRPFVLLAILAAASGSRSLHGHGLYDDEFRKILGLKFVAGGERSLELLQGLLVYCVWYPFHLRPKNKQAYQYIRMATDLVHDLGLDQESPEFQNFNDTSMPQPQPTEHQMDCARAYLGWFHMTASMTIAWKKHGLRPAPYTSWTASCCDLLERNAKTQNDAVLAAAVRLSAANTEADAAIHDNCTQTDQQRRLLLLGLESHLRDLEARMPPYVASSVPIRMQALFVRIYLLGGSLLRLRRPAKHHNSNRAPVFPSDSKQGRLPLAPELPRLRDCVEAIRDFLSYLTGLSEASMSRFSAPDWFRFVLVFVVAIRLSFPVPECPDFDTSWARSRLGFQETLDKFASTTSSRSSASSSSSPPVPSISSSSGHKPKVDAVSALRVIVDVLKDKYYRKLAALERSQAAAAAATMEIGLGCPMLDGSLDKVFPAWDAAMPSMAGLGTGYYGGHHDNGKPPTVGQVGSEAGQEQDQQQQQSVFHDLWATMTMGWAGSDGVV